MKFQLIAQYSFCSGSHGLMLKRYGFTIKNDGDGTYSIHGNGMVEINSMHELKYLAKTLGKLMIDPNHPDVITLLDEDLF